MVDPVTAHDAHPGAGGSAENRRTRSSASPMSIHGSRRPEVGGPPRRTADIGGDDQVIVTVPVHVTAADAVLIPEMHRGICAHTSVEKPITMKLSIPPTQLSSMRSTPRWCRG